MKEELDWWIESWISRLATDIPVQVTKLHRALCVTGPYVIHDPGECVQQTRLIRHPGIGVDLLPRPALILRHWQCQRLASVRRSVRGTGDIRCSGLKRGQKYANLFFSILSSLFLPLSETHFERNRPRVSVLRIIWASFGLIRQDGGRRGAPSPRKRSRVEQSGADELPESSPRSEAVAGGEEEVAGGRPRSCQAGR